MQSSLKILLLTLYVELLFSLNIRKSEKALSTTENGKYELIGKCKYFIIIIVSTPVASHLKENANRLTMKQPEYVKPESASDGLKVASILNGESSKTVKGDSNNISMLAMTVIYKFYLGKT